MHLPNDFLGSVAEQVMGSFRQLRMVLQMQLGIILNQRW
jgi:hypothetical protein